MKNCIKYSVIGVSAGIINGLFGAGGGMLLVPLLSRWANLEYRKALATSVAVILPLSVTSVCIYLFRHDFKILSAVPYAIGGLIGGIIGGKIFHHIPIIWIRRIFSAFVIYGGVKNLF